MKSKNILKRTQCKRAYLNYLLVCHKLSHNLAGQNILQLFCVRNSCTAILALLHQRVSQAAIGVVWAEVISKITGRVSAFEIFGQDSAPYLLWLLAKGLPQCTGMEVSTIWQLALLKHLENNMVC